MNAIGQSPTAWIPHPTPTAQATLAVAQATTYCVSDPACVSAGGTSQPNLQAALNAASASPGADRVEIGAGTFHSAGAGGFFYSSAIPGNHVDVVGAGSTLTTLTAPDQPDPGSTSTLLVQSLPSAGDSLPYAMAVDDEDRLWIVETGPQPNRLVGFDPASGLFFAGADVPSGGGNVRHMVFSPRARELWFGTDEDTIGRARVP